MPLENVEKNQRPNKILVLFVKIYNFGQNKNVFKGSYQFYNWHYNDYIFIKKFKIILIKPTLNII